MQFIKGEKKEVKIQILSRKNDPFTIRNASYELMKWNVKEPENAGQAHILGNEIFAVVQPLTAGVYNLIFTYEIAQEILKASVQLEVR
jgi:hypothetical protein